MFTGIDHVVFLVRDMDISVHWYESRFGLPVERLDEWRAGESFFVSLRISKTVIIDLVQGDPTGTNVDHIALVTDRDHFDTFVADNGDLIEMGPSELSGAQGQGLGIYLRDPDGHRLEVRTYG